MEKILQIIFTKKCENVSLIKVNLNEDNFENWKEVQFSAGDVNIEYKVNMKQVAKGAFLHNVMKIKERDNFADIYTIAGLVYEDIPLDSYEAIDLQGQIKNQIQNQQISMENIDANTSVRGLPPSPGKGSGGCGGCGNK